MEGANIFVPNINSFTFLDVWKLPGLLEVLGSFFQEEVITVGIAVAWSLYWSIWAGSFSAEFRIIVDIHFVNVLAWVAIPELVMSILLPPLTVKTGKGGLWVDIYLRAGSWNWSKSNTLSIHSA